MNRVPIVITCLTLLRSVALCSASNLPSNQVPPVVSLQQDARLDRKITIETTGIALKDLLRQVGGKEVVLVASRLCAEQKLQLRLNSRPLRALMDSLSTLLGGNWQPTEDGKGYLFQQSDETILRRRRWWTLFQGEHALALDTLHDLALRGMNPPPAGNIQISSGEEDPEEAKASIARLRAELDTKHDFFVQLPPELKDRVARAASADPFVGAMEADTGLPLDGSVVIPLSELPPNVQEVARHVGRVFPGKNAQDIAFVRFHNSGVGIRATLLDAHGGTVDEISTSVDAREINPALSLDQRPLAEEVRREGRNASPTWKELAAYQNSRVWANDPVPDAKPRFRVVHGRSIPVYPRFPPRRSDVLDYLAEQTNLEFVADYYSRPYIAFKEKGRPLEHPLKAELDRRADEQDMSWRQDHGIYLFRDNRWYRDDELEVPNDLIRRWMSEFATLDRDRPKFPIREAPVPRDYAQRVLNLRCEMVNLLTLWQLENGFKYSVYRPQTDPIRLNFGPEGPQMLAAMTVTTHIGPLPVRPSQSTLQFPFGILADHLVEDRNTLLFYAELSAEQRSALLAGTLPYSALDGNAQQAALFLTPMLPFALKQSEGSGEPVLLNLETRISGGFGGETDIFQTSWMERSGIGTLQLGIMSPVMFIHDDVRMFAP